MSEREPDVLLPQLVRAERSLKHALSQVCHAQVSQANTGELIRLEEVLAIANEAAKEAVSVRRKMRSTPADRIEDRGATNEDSGLGANREFDDVRGVRWMVFAVYPSSARVARSGLRAQFQEGWLAFDSGVETRRLAPIPNGWLGMLDDELAAACDRAELAPNRKQRQK